MDLYRANPAYELVPYEQLAPPARELLADLRAEPSFFGVLRPTDGASLPMLAIDRENATLFLALREEGPLSEESGRSVARLMFDHVLQIRRNGEWISGAAAIEARRRAGRDRIGRLSIAALEYAHRLPLTPAEIASRLSAYNTVPIPRRARSRVFTARGSWRTTSDAEWQVWSRLSVVSCQLSGQQLTDNRQLTTDNESHDLYVSPRPEFLGDCVEALASSEATQFRVATTPRGQHRADKLIASFASIDALRDVASRLESALKGIAPQGVPFTAQIGGDGLLSWSTPRWRRWLLHRLARAVVASRDAGATAEHAVERIALDGIDVERWIPA